MVGDVLVYDADAHVVPSEQMWNCLEDAYRERRPTMVSLRGQPGRGVLDAAWLVDGRVLPHPVGRGTHWGSFPPEARLVAARTAEAGAAEASDPARPWTPGSQELSDPGARLQDMDRLGIDVTVIYPSTTFAYGLMTADYAFEGALYRAHNTYLARQCRQAPERLKWAAVVPLHDMAEAVREAERARELGAAVFVLYGTVGERLLHEPQFDPFFAAAERLGLPVAIHIGPSYPSIQSAADSHVAQLTVAMTVPLLMASYSVLCGGLPDRHPTLRFVFLEAGAEWLPFMVHRFDHYYGSARTNGYPFTWNLAGQSASDYLRSGRIYVSAEPEEALLPVVLELIGEDQVVYASDIPHAECREDPVREILGRPDLAETTRRKIVGLNARRLYEGR
jgi:predicted TIM-barrel fold metal-dependent hydrolase